VDLSYTASRVISPVYLLEGLVEVLLVLGWVRFPVAQPRAGQGVGPGLPH
jgi:hypothetical protein